MRLIDPARRAVRRAMLLVLLLGGALPAMAQDATDLPPVTRVFQVGGAIAHPGEVALHFTVAPGYYLYRGRLHFKADDGATLGQPVLPDGRKYHDDYLGDVETYEHDFDATLPYTAAPGATKLTLAVQMQGCREVAPKVCYPPHTDTVELALPATVAGDETAAGRVMHPFGAAPSGATVAPLPAEQAFRLDAAATAPGRLLLRWTMPHGYYLYRDRTTLALADAPGLTLGTLAWPAGTLHDDPNLGRTTVYFGEVDVPVAIAGDRTGRHTVRLTATFQGCQDGGLCYPPTTRRFDVELPTAGTTTATSASGGGAGTPNLWLALVLALLGGLVLNLMPCVLPVLSIKAVGLIESGESPRRRRQHALAYSTGVLASFLALGGAIVALRAGGHALGWGTQLQQPLVVGGLALVMFAVGLSMSGVVQFGASLGNVGGGLAQRGGMAGDFFTGVLAVVVASPCTAPFMGSALAYAFAAPVPAACGVFFALGLGLALPFLAVGFVPGLARWLPRPSRWMETLKQVLAFPMYLTAAWLAWVLAHQRGADAVGLLLAATVLLALTLWWFERSRAHGTASRALVLLCALATAVPLYLLATLPLAASTATATTGVVDYNPARLDALRKAGTPVFVDMTADWCVTCKANEHAVLDTDAFHALLQRTGAVYMKGDWTDVNPTIAAFLDRYHSPGVPLYVVFPRGGGPGRVLPTVLTGSLVEHALTDAAR